MNYISFFFSSNYIGRYFQIVTFFILFAVFRPPYENVPAPPCTIVQSIVSLKKLIVNSVNVNSANLVPREINLKAPDSYLF